MKTFILILSILLVISCGSDDDSNTSFEPITIDFIEIANGIGGNENGIFEGFVISNQSEWEDFLNFSVHPYFHEQLSELEINFEEFMLVALISGILPNTGHSIYITDITEYENEVIINSEIVNSGSGFNVLCQSFAVVKIPITHKPLVFE